MTDDDVNQGDSGEDKVEKKALQEKKTPQEIAKFYEEDFRRIEKELNILPAHYFPRATAHVPQIIKLIKRLIEKEYAYVVNGNVFFDVKKFPDYGKLSGNSLENLKVGARLEEHPDKKNPWDFALWLKAPKEHLMKWESPWGIGYPGWHIECSAMSTEYLGNTIDIHTGGEDNIFPHHEAEIAQSECANEEKFVKYWVHIRHLLIDGKKMSKSKGSLYLLKDIKEKGYSPMDLRMVMILSHYRSQMNFTWDSIKQAHSNLETINNFYSRLLNYEPSTEEKLANFSTDTFKKEFEEAMSDDFNTPESLAVVLKMINEGNKLIDENLMGNPAEVKKVLESFAKVFGLILGKDKIPEKVEKIAEERKTARNEKNFEKSDELRDEILKLGYIIKDLKDNGFILKKKLVP